MPQAPLHLSTQYSRAFIPVPEHKRSSIGCGPCFKLKEALFPPREGSSNLSWPVPRPLNRLLAWIFASERHVLRHVSAPFGHSLFVVARRPLEHRPTP